MKTTLTQSQVNALVDAAQAARENSYSPYSNFKVGAAVLTDDGKIFCGTNIENSSYGLTVCAERNALFAAAGAGYRRFKALALITQKIKGQKFNSPCGACRQVISEFLAPATPVYIAVLDGKTRKVYCKKFSELMPFPFDKFTEK